MKKLFPRLVAAVTVPLYTLVAGSNSYAIVPHYAKLFDVIGPNTISILRNGNYVERAGENTRMYKYDDELVIPNEEKTSAKLDFFNEEDKFLQVAFKADKQNDILTHYIFPCTIKNGDIVDMKWRNPADNNSDCKDGVRVEEPKSLSGRSWLDFLFALGNKQGFREDSYLNYHCTVSNQSGSGYWFGYSDSPENPCKDALEQCQGECIKVSIDRWVVRRDNLTVIAQCEDDNQDNVIFKEGVPGSKVKEVADQLQQKAKEKSRKNCSLGVIEDTNIIVSPVGEEENLSRVRNQPSCLQVEVEKGETLVRSAQKPEGELVDKNTPYSYCGSIIYVPIKPPEPLCQAQPQNENQQKQNDIITRTGSWGTETLIIDLAEPQGQIEFDYSVNAFSDRIQVKHGEQILIDVTEDTEQELDPIFFNGNTPGFQGNPLEIQVIVTSNQEVSTQWGYSLTCSRIED